MGNDYGSGGLSASDVALLTGRGGNGGNGGFGDGNGAWWVILLLLALGGWGGRGFGGYGGGDGGGSGGTTFIPYNVGGFGGGFSNEYAWLSNGQKEIMQNTNNGFNTLYLSNQLNDINNGVQGLSTQLCNCCADISQSLCSGFAGVNQTVNAGFANAETSANARQMANMQQSFNNQIATLQGFNGVQQGFNGIQSKLADCCCENRLATQDLKATVISENCADREVLRQIGQEILVNATSNTQKIIDEIFRDRLDEKDSKIAELNRQLTQADLRASQIQQTSNIVDMTYNRLRDCPIDSTPIYGRQPIFTCPNNNNNGCGCGCGGNNNLF